MGRLNGFAVNDRFLERVGFSVAAFEYFMALEESELYHNFETFWPSMVAACLHIQRVDYPELREIGESFVNRYLNGLIGYKPKQSSPQFCNPYVQDAVCAEIDKVLTDGECVQVSQGRSPYVVGDDALDCVVGE